MTGKELSTNDYTTAEKIKLAAITGTNTGDQDLSALATTAAVAQKANAADVTTSLATKVDKVTGKELSTNDYTTAEKTKLAAITGTNTGDQTNITGNAATATKLLTAVTINGIAFDGSANVTIPATGAVPYTGATQAADLGAYDLKVNAITIGRGAGNIDDNTAIGSQALLSNTTGVANTALGQAALSQNTIGTRNTATGSNALQNNTEGANNTAHGRAALRLNTTGSNNTAVGFQAFAQNTTGSNNTAIGHGTSMVDGLSNATAIGAGATVLASNTIQLGNSSVTDVKTSGTLTAGAVTYPNVHNTTAGQVLTTNASGVASWATPAVAGTWSITTISNTPMGLTFSSGSGFYSRVGNIVSFSASVKFRGSSYGMGGQTFFEIDLPIPSDFTATNDANGTVSGINIDYYGIIGGFIESNSTSNKLKIRIEGGMYGSIYDPQLGISGMYIVK